MTLEQINKYSVDLQAKVDARKTDFADNKDCAHNAAVMECMLNNASTITMYCGKFSSFRKDFYEQINAETRGGDTSYVPTKVGDDRISTTDKSLDFSYPGEPDTSSCISICEEGLGDIMRKRVLAALEGFLQREGTSLEVVVENPDNDILESTIFSDSAVFNHFRDKIKITTLTQEFPLRGKLFHFSYTDQKTGMIRIEENAKSHAATCSFFIPEESGVLQNLKDTFSNLRTWEKGTFSL